MERPDKEFARPIYWVSRSVGHICRRPGEDRDSVVGWTGREVISAGFDSNWAKEVLLCLAREVAELRADMEQRTA